MVLVLTGSGAEFDQDFIFLLLRVVAMFLVMWSVMFGVQAMRRKSS